MTKKYDDEDGVWRTIGGRRIFIKKGQDLASAMKESGKFKSAKKVNKKDESEESDLDKVKRIQSDLDKKGDKLTKEEKAWKEQLANTQKELESGKSREDIIKDLDREALRNTEKPYGSPEERKEYFAKSDEEKAEMFNKKMDERSEVIDRLDKETAELDNYDRYNLAVSKLENTEGMRPTERQYWAGIKERYEKSQKANSDREELRNTEKEYGELSKKMQADDYYYKPEDDRKLKELRAKADSERARQGIDTQEKYDKLMSEDSNKKEQFSVSELKKKAQATLPKEDIDTHEGDLYLKKTKESEALIKNMKDSNNGMVSTFRDQQTGETWYDIPFANMNDDYKEKYKHSFPFHEKTEKEKKYAEEVAEYYKDKDIKQEIAKAKKEAEKSTNDIMNEKIRSRGKSKVEEDESTKSKTKEFWNKEDSNDTDLNKFNDKARAKFGKIDYYGNGRKSNAVEIEMELKDGNFSAMGFIKNARGTDSVSGGQNIDEIADLMKDNKDVQEIHSLWKKYHLNQMHAGTEKQEEALEKFKSERKAIAEQMNKGKTYDWQKVDEKDYEVTKKLLENHNLLEDNGYKYGTSWLKREIPDDDKRRIISLINKYNGKSSNTETSNKTTNQTMNETLRNAFNDYRKKHKNSDMSFTEFMRINKK